MKGALKNKLHDCWLFVGYFIVNLLCFYRRDLFFRLDDYFVILSWARARWTLRYLLAPHNEHFVPLAKLFYAIEIVCFREHYGLFILTNCALMAMTALLWKKFLQRLGSPVWLAIAIPLLACTSAPSQENIMLAWQSGLILSAASLIGAVWAYLDKRLYACFFFAAVSALTFSSDTRLPRTGRISTAGRFRHERPSLADGWLLHVGPFRFPCRLRANY